MRLLTRLAASGRRPVGGMENFATPNAPLSVLLHLLVAEVCRISSMASAPASAMPLPYPPESRPNTRWLDPASGQWLAVPNYEDAFATHFLLPQDFDLAEQRPVARPTPEQLDSIQNNALFEGDILGMVGETTASSGRHTRSADSIFSEPYHSSLNTGTYPDKLWVDGRVPYMLEESMTESQRVAIAQAFDEYKQKTCIRFVPRELDDDDYIYVSRNDGSGCSSYVGRAGGNQTVSLEVEKCFSKGIIAHELMHAIGFFHEHSRTDRDHYVNIEHENVRPGMLRNFEKYPKKIIDPLAMPYDYESVMHYHKLAFSRNGKPTIWPKNSSAEIGQRFKLSAVDAMKVNKLYQCDEDENEMRVGVGSPSTTTPTATTTTDEEEEEVEWSSTPPTTSTAPIKSTTTEALLPTTTTTSDGGWPFVVRRLITISVFTFRSTTTTPAPALATTTAATATPHPTPYPAGPTIYKSLKRVMGKVVGEIGEMHLRPSECKDLNAHCEMWERLGHCEHSVKYMSHYCRRSCRLCHVVGEGKGLEKTTTAIEPPRPRQLRHCSDKNLFCGYWAKMGECRSGSRFMKAFCKRSCGHC